MSSSEKRTSNSASLILETPLASKLLDEVAALDDPRSRGHALTGDLGGLWRYRAGDWRIIARFENRRVVILVVEIGHRREVYR